MLYEHTPHSHKIVNINAIHELEKATAGINQRIALFLTKIVATMGCAYFFAFLALVGFPGLLGPQTALYVQWVSQTFIQLTMLSILMVGQSVLSRKQELQADEQYHTTIHSFHDIEQIIEHLNAQDEIILRQEKMMATILEQIEHNNT